jgi:hypothetical protein
MAASLSVRGEYSASDLRAFARRSADAQQVRRLLALSSILDGGTRSEAAKIGGVTLQIVRDWVIRFNAEGPEGLTSRKAPGKPSSWVMSSGGLWPLRSKQGRSRLRTVWFAGG